MNVFDRYYKKYDAWYDRNKFAYLSEQQALKKVLPGVGKGLEIGVGTGRFAHSLGITFGIDPSVEMLRIAAGRGVSICCGFGEDLPFLAESFDYVAIIISLCFVNNPLKVLQESHRVLKKNSKLIIGIVDRESFLGRFYQQKKSIFYKKAKFFSVKELTKLLNNLDFKRISYCQTLFDLPETINSVQNPRKEFGEGGFVVISGEKTE